MFIYLFLCSITYTIKMSIREGLAYFRKTTPKPHFAHIPTAVQTRPPLSSFGLFWNNNYNKDFSKLVICWNPIIEPGWENISLSKLQQLASLIKEEEMRHSGETTLNLHSHMCLYFTQQPCWGGLKNLFWWIHKYYACYLMTANK